MVDIFVPAPRRSDRRVRAEANGPVERDGLVEIRDHARDKGEADDRALLANVRRPAHRRSAKNQPRRTDRDHPFENAVPVQCDKSPLAFAMSPSRQLNLTTGLWTCTAQGQKELHRVQVTLRDCPHISEACLLI